MNATPKFGKVLLIVMMCTVAVACSKKVKEEPAPPPPSTVAPAPDTGPVTPGAYTPEDLDTDACLRQRVVYFDFDSYVVKDEYRPVVEANARALAADRKRRIAVEGHTDERGGREYNLALGQKRAEAVKQRLMLLGVVDSQVETVSFGEEKPRGSGSSEEAWAQNRRADLNYR